MASFVYAVWSITHVASVHCAMRPELSPCTCEPTYAHNYVELSCEKVDSFHRIVDALSNKFEPFVNVSLKISHSQLEDLEMRSFTDMKLNVVKLRMQWNGLKMIEADQVKLKSEMSTPRQLKRPQTILNIPNKKKSKPSVGHDKDQESLPELPFRGLSNVEFLSVGDNELDEIPKHMLNHMPLVKSLDIGRCRIRSVLQDDFKGIQLVTNLFLPSNNITRLDKGAFPPGLVTLHLGRNQIESLNGTLRNLNKLESLFINMNNISSLDDELPESNRLNMIMAQNNKLGHLPESMRYMNKLEALHLQCNRLRSLNGIFTNAKNLNCFSAYNNEIEYLASNEFQSSELLQELDLSLNHIKALNHSLLPLRGLCTANFSFNDIEEFSMNEIRGLMNLSKLDLSNNRIQKLTGRQENNIDQNSFLIEFNLDHNQLKSLDGALMGLNRLRILSLSYNQIERILPEDFIGLVKLEILELSHNQLLTLKEMETTFLPNLKILKVAYNNLTKLEKDFHGLPVLCQANMTNNQISSISAELVSETRCMNHNVPGKLELHLDDNPIMCDERLNELCPLMMAQETRIRGRSQCFENDQEVCTVLPMLFTRVINLDNLPLILQQQLNQKPGSQSSNNKPLVKVIVPPILLNKNKKTDELFPPLITPLGQPIIKPLIIAPTSMPTQMPTTIATTTTTTAAKAILDTTAANQQESNAAAYMPTKMTINDDAVVRKIKMAAATTHKANLHKKIAEHDSSILPISSAENASTVPNYIEAVTTSNDEINETTINNNSTIPTTTISTTTTTIKSTEMLAPEMPPLVLNIEEPAAIVPPSLILNDPSNIGTGALRPTTTVNKAALSNTQTEYATVEYIPNLDEFATISREAPPPPPPPSDDVVLEEDSNSNSVHEDQFPSAILADLDNPQSLLIPEEPPENP